MFNLGWMFQTGWGVSQDFERAKVRIKHMNPYARRNLSTIHLILTTTGMLQEYYTKCMDTSSEAKVPALLSLKGMHAHMKYKVCVNLLYTTPGVLKCGIKKKKEPNEIL